MDKEEEKPRHFWDHNDYSGYSRDDLYIEQAKFRDLREEALESGHCALDHFDEMTFKAEELMKTMKVKGLKAKSYGHAKHYGISDDAAITVKHIQSVLLYTDFTKLCSIFSGTLRAAHLCESLDSIKVRNASWFEMSKLLRETVECFGNMKPTDINQNGERGPFYCGVNRLMLVPSFGIRLCSPTSTSKESSVAIRFADTEGMVMRFNNESSVRFFDCSYVSAYTEESERLFFGGDYRNRVESVMVMDGFKDYHRYFRVFYAFDLMLCGAGAFRIDFKEKIPLKDQEILKWFIDGVVNKIECDDRVHDDYVIDTFNAYTRNKTDIVINLNLMDHTFPPGLYQHIVHNLVAVRDDDYQWNEPEDMSMNMMRWKRLFTLFPSLEKLTIYGTDDIGWYKFPFSIAESATALNEIFVESECIKMVEIKGIHRHGKKSWIHDAFVASKGGLEGAVLSLSLSNEKSFWQESSDVLRIQRK